MPSGMVRTTCTSTFPAGAGAGAGPPAKREVGCDVGDGRAGDAARDVVPADRATRLVLRSVPAIPVERSQIDTADVGNTIVDHDRLFMMAVHRPLPGIEGALDPVPHIETLLDLANVTTPRPQNRQRRACPDQNANGDARAQLTKQIPKYGRLSIASEPEVGREMPARQVDSRLRAPQVFDHSGEGLLAVYQYFEGVALSWWRVTVSPETGLADHRPLPADLPQAALVVGDGKTF
jgi:hypothetical protein